MGRPRKFDPDTALRSIQDVFWRLGYEGASLQEIERATGLNKQSLYRLFGGKREMYLRALQAYDEDEIGASAEILTGGDSGAQARVARLFDRIVDYVCRTGDRRGCFLCNASVDQAQLDPETRARTEAMMTRLKDAFTVALRADAAYRQSPRKRETAAMTLMAGYFGLRVLVKANLDEAALRKAARGIVAGI